MAMRGQGPQRRYSAGPYPAAVRGDENAPPDGFDAAPFTLGPKGPGAASRHSFHFRATRPPLGSSSSMYNRKQQLPAPTPKNSSGVMAAAKAPARMSVARTSFAPPTKRLRKTSSAEILVSKCVSVSPANLEGCQDECFLSLELEWGIHKIILVEELKSCVEACRQKEAIIYTLECDLSESIQESNGLEKINVKSQELLKQRDSEILRLNSLLEKANINSKDQQDHVSCSSAEQERDYVSRQVEFHSEVIASLATEQVSIKEQLAASKEKELVAKQNLGEIELLLNESIEAIVQKEVIVQNYASLVMDMKEEIHRLESQLEQSKSCYKGRLKEPEIRMQEMNDQVVASLISRNKEIRKIHAEEKNEILKKNKMLEISIEDFKDTVYSLEEKANKFEEEAQQQRRKREKLEVELHNLRQQSLIALSSGKAESSLKDGMTDLATRVLSYRNNELLCSQESWRICRMESMVAEQLEEEMAQLHLSHEEYQPVSSQFEHPSPTEQPEFYSNGADSDQAPSESELGEQVPPEALKPTIEVVEEKELPPVAPVQDRKPMPIIEVVEEELPPVAPVQDRNPLNYALAPSDELKRLRTINHYEGQRTATDRRFWSIEQDLYTSLYKNAQVFKMKWIDWGHISSIDQFDGIKERCASLGLEQIMSYYCAWDAELIRQFYSTVHISTDKSSITWMANGRKITTNKRAWEETFETNKQAEPSQISIHSEFWLDDDDKRILYTDAEPSQISGLNPLTIIAKKIAWSTIYPRTGNNIDGHDWNLLYHIVKQQPFDIIALIFGEIDLIISGCNGTKGMLSYAPYIMGMIMKAFEYDGPRESSHCSYKPRPSYNYKQKRRNRCSCPPAPAAAALFEPPPSAFQPETVDDVDAGNQQQFDAAGHQPQGELVHGQAELTVTQPDLHVVEDGLRPIRHPLADVSAQPASVRPSPFGRFPWYQREK